jgi:heptosyltransferase-1
MGDIVHTMPAVTALRRAFPAASMGWIVEERWAELLCTLRSPRSGPLSPARPLVNRVHAIDTKRWRTALFSTQTWERVAAAISELRAPKYEVAIDLQGALRSALLARWSGASAVYGFRQPRESVASMFYTHQVIAAGSHIVEQNLSLIEAVAQRPLELPAIKFPCDETEEKKLADRWQREGFDNFVLLNPGAGWRSKQWPPERYGDVALRLAQLGFRSLINFGPGEEDLARQVESASGGAAQSISCSITELISLTRRARLFIGGDTGPMHLAAALDVPVVAIFGPTDPKRNGPFATRSIILRSPASPTTRSRRSQPDPGLLEITTDRVFGAAQQLLENHRG